MSDDWKSYLIRTGAAAAIGLVVGILIRRQRPEWSRRWATFGLSRRWKWYAFSTLFFGAAAMICWNANKRPEAVGAFVLVLLSVVSLIRRGFLPVVPDEERDAGVP